MTLASMKRLFCISFLALAGGLSASALNATPSQPHTWRNASDTDELRVLWVSVPNPY